MLHNNMRVVEMTRGASPIGFQKLRNGLNPVMLFMSPSPHVSVSPTFLGGKPRQRRMAGPCVLSSVFLAVPQ